jgi:hypothetical protein
VSLQALLHLAPFADAIDVLQTDNTSLDRALEVWVGLRKHCEDIEELTAKKILIRGLEVKLFFQTIPSSQQSQCLKPFQTLIRTFAWMLL